MAASPESVEISPPCLINPTKDCHPPCLNFTVCDSFFTDAAAMFGNTRAEQRQIAQEEGELEDNRRLLVTALRQSGIYQRCLPVMTLALEASEKKL